MIKNYTSTVPVETSIQRIEAKLAVAGASGIMKLYGPDKKVTPLVFRFDLQGRSFSFRIPANSSACFDAMWKEHCLKHSRVRPETQQTIKEQAHRTAWKLVQDWVEIQISMIVLKQVEFLEVFLPYAWDGKQTYFEALKQNQYKALPPCV
ncbi:MAG: hypothetical protein WC378_17830 [Opitutaceae bacterium]